MLNIFMEPTPYKVAAVKIEFDGGAVPDYYGIDAVAISDSNYPIIADIPTMQLLASGILIEVLDKNVNTEYKELNPAAFPRWKDTLFQQTKSSAKHWRCKGQRRHMVFRTGFCGTMATCPEYGCAE